MNLPSLSHEAPPRLAGASPDVAYALDGLAFDPRRIRSDYQELLRRAPAYAGLGTDPGLGLTHRPGAPDPWRDAAIGQFNPVTGAKRYEEEEFSSFQDGCRDLVFFEIYRCVPFRVGRMRLITLDPADIYHMHTDSTRKAHVAVETNEDCRLLFRTGQTYRVPLDGRVHLIDTRTPHSAYNAGEQSRVHLVLSVLDAAEVRR